MIAMSIVGSSVVAGKFIVQSFPIFLANELRFAVATVVLMPLWLKVEGFSTCNKKELVVIFFQTLLGVFLFNVLMLHGLSKTGAIEAGIITGTLPACTAILAYFILKEKFTRYTGTGVLCAVIGTIFMNITSLSATIHLSTSFVGNLFIVGAVCCEALFIIFGKSLSHRMSALTVSTMVSCFGALLFLPFAVMESQSFAFEEVSATEWGLIVYFGIVVTVLGFLLMQSGLQVISASWAGILTSFLPVTSIILSTFLLAEKITFLQGCGFVFIIGAFYLLSKQQATPQ
ncbi:hypothetical protein ADM90_21095 [Lysinibacillus macroides]|uniref:EamA domain-containing protein n=2 Tax=Lysinibacillus macroides TaxID=33935 RepID=A0A0M9DHF7_9BACI|nr:hypothetical protein ADM90_21095 [Lysinibacillus macroides]